MVRGIAGFGTDHKLHTSNLVDLADQMPMKIEFLESSEKVQEVLPKLSEMASNGLIEVHDTTVIRPEKPGTKQKGELPAIKLESQAKIMRILIGESDKWNGKPLHEALVQALRANDIAGVTVYRGISVTAPTGACTRTRRSTSRTMPPILLTVVESETKLRAFFPVLDQMVKQGLIVCPTPTSSSTRMPCPTAGGGEMKLTGKAKMLRIHFGEDDQWQGQPLYQAIVERCRQMDIAGATVFRGIQGYGASTIVRRRHLLSFSSDAPILVQVIDTAENIQRLIPVLDEMVKEGLMAMSDVEVVKYVHQDGKHPQE